jgi:hypothetical protein
MRLVDLGAADFAKSEWLSLFDGFQVPVGQFLIWVFLVSLALFFFDFKNAFAGWTCAEIIQIPANRWNEKDMKSVVTLDDFFRQQTVALFAFHLAVSEQFVFACDPEYADKKHVVISHK